MYAGVRRSDAGLRHWRQAARNTVVKLGPHGSRWIAGVRADGGDVAQSLQSIDVSAPAPRVRAVDTTGAGDAFNGGFLFGWLGGASPRECLRLGNFVGAQSTLAAGGVAGLPVAQRLKGARRPSAGPKASATRGRG